MLVSFSYIMAFELAAATYAGETLYQSSWAIPVSVADMVGH
jgi:hypothetical protein